MSTKPLAKPKPVQSQIVGDCMGILEFGWSSKYVLPLADATQIMQLFRSAQKLENGSEGNTLKPIDEYPKLSLLPTTIYKQIKVNNLLDMG